MYNTKPAQFQAQRTTAIKEYSLPEDEDTLLIAPDVTLYTQMRESERKLDWTMARKVLEMQETVTRVIRVCHLMLPPIPASIISCCAVSEKKGTPSVRNTHSSWPALASSRWGRACRFQYRKRRTFVGAEDRGEAAG